MVSKVALLTAGGFAPCLSSAIGGLIERYSAVAPDVEIIAYRYGYQGLLAADRLQVTPAVREHAALLDALRGIADRQLPGQADQRRRSGQARSGGRRRGPTAGRRRPAHRGRHRRPAHHRRGRHEHHRRRSGRLLADHDYSLTVVGLPKTIDNDVIPIKQSLGAWTAAEQGSRFAQNILAEHNSGSRMLIVHEVMGRHCGWLTAATAAEYRSWLDSRTWLPEIGLGRQAGTCTGCTCRRPSSIWTRSRRG